MFFLPDFPHTWKRLSEEEKFVANRRMATDGSEADLDEKGGMSQMRGLKLAFTDPKVFSFPPHRLLLSNHFVADLHYCLNVPLHHWRNWLPKLLPITHRGAVPEQQYRCSASRGTTLPVHGILLLPAQLRLRQIQNALLVLELPNSNCHGWLLRLYVHERFWFKIF